MTDHSTPTHGLASTLRMRTLNAGSFLSDIRIHRRVFLVLPHGQSRKGNVFLLTKRIHVLFLFLGTALHIFTSSYFSNLRIYVIASEEDWVLSYEEKTLIM